MLPAIISFIVCVGVPAAGGIYFLRRRDGTFLTFITGILGFYISQPVLRIPLLRLLMQSSTTLALLPYTSIALYYLFAGFTAGFFEESARFVGLGVFRRGHTSWMDGMAYGLGHGGCEAAWLFFTQVLPLISQGQAGFNVILGAWERIFTIMVHIGLSFLVLHAVKTSQKRYFILAIALHTLVDFLIVIGNVRILEGLIAIEGLTAIILVFRYKKKEKNRKESV